MSNLMRTYRYSFILSALSIVATTLIASSQSIGTENTLVLESPDNQPNATLSDVAWIAGHWEAEALGGIAEEIWSEPHGDSIMGMFRLIQDGKVRFFELLAITEEDESLVLRLKHFNPDMTGWEEKNERMEFPLVKITEHEINFSGLTMRRIDENTMHIFVMSKQGETLRELFFDYKRKDLTH
jgi:hypothetical protein